MIHFPCAFCRPVLKYRTILIPELERLLEVLALRCLLAELKRIDGNGRKCIRLIGLRYCNALKLDFTLICHE